MILALVRSPERASDAADDDDDSFVAIIMFSENPRFRGIAFSRDNSESKIEKIIAKESNLWLLNEGICSAACATSYINLLFLFCLV